MRIGLISGEYPPHEGGVGAYTRILGAALADAGHTVTVLAGPSARESDPRLTLDRVDGWGFGCWAAVDTWTRRRQVEAINLQYQTAAYGMSPWIHFIPGRVQAAPTVVTFHDLRVPYLFPKAGRLRLWIVNHLAKAADGVIATNPEDYERLRALPRAALIPIGSNIAPAGDEANPDGVRARYGIGAHDPLIVFFGLINHSKGLDTLIAALGSLRGRGLPVRLLVIGSAGSSDPTNQAYAAALHQQIAAAGLDSAITFTGFVAESNVDVLLRAADVVALPFADGASLRRGSLMAALSAGCALVTTTPAVPTPGFVDGESMRLVPPGDASALADALAQVLNDPALRARLQAGANALSRQFEWPAIARSVAALLAQAVEGTRR